MAEDKGVSFTKWGPKCYQGQDLNSHCGLDASFHFPSGEKTVHFLSNTWEGPKDHPYVAKGPTPSLNYTHE